MSKKEDDTVQFYVDQGNPYSVAFELARRDLEKQSQDAADRAKADAQADAAKQATSKFLSSFSGYESLAGKNLSPTDAAALISLQQTARANELTLTAQKREVVGSVIGDTNASMNPLGGGPANPPVHTGGRSTLIAFVLAVVGFLILRKR